MWPLLSLTAFLEPEVRVECWVRTSVPVHPTGCCCRLYKGATSPQTPRAPHCRAGTAVNFPLVDNYPEVGFHAAGPHIFCSHSIVTAPISHHHCLCQCSKSCGTGIKTREVKCLDPSLQPSLACNNKRRPHERRPCNKHACRDNATASRRRGNDYDVRPQIAPAPQRYAESTSPNTTYQSYQRNRNRQPLALQASAPTHISLQKDVRSKWSPFESALCLWGVSGLPLCLWGVSGLPLCLFLCLWGFLVVVLDVCRSLLEFVICCTSLLVFVQNRWCLSVVVSTLSMICLCCHLVLVTVSWACLSTVGVCYRLV